VKDIMALHESHQTQAVVKSIKEFRKWYPRYTLPEVLRQYEQ